MFYVEYKTRRPHIWTTRLFHHRHHSQRFSARSTYSKKWATTVAVKAITTTCFRIYYDMGWDRVVPVYIIYHSLGKQREICLKITQKLTPKSLVYVYRHFRDGYTYRLYCFAGMCKSYFCMTNSSEFCQRRQCCCRYVVPPLQFSSIPTCFCPGLCLGC